MPSLGKAHRLIVKGQGETPDEGHEAWVEYRDATADEWTKFQGEMAEIVKGERQGERLSVLCYNYGRDLVTDAGGFDVPDDLSQKEALTRYAPDLVAEIGERVYMRGGGRKLDLGKSVLPSAPSSVEKSVRSSKKPASTSG